LLITYNNKSAFLNHVTQIAIVIKLEQALVPRLPSFRVFSFSFGYSRVPCRSGF
jgi:hypothetical protein